MKQEMQRRSWLVIASIALIAVGWWMLRPQPVAVDLSPVTRGRLQLTVRDDGRTRIREKYVVSTPVAGRLIRIDLKPGDSVFAGETVLGVIEPTDPSLLDPRALAEAQAREKASEARLSQVEPRQQLAQQRLKFTEAELQRVRSLAAKNAIGQQMLDEASLAHETAVAEHTEAAFSREIAEYELKMARAVLMHTNPSASYPEVEAFRFPIQAPISGKVLRVLQESATIVQAGEPLLELGDPSDLEIEIDILSTDAVKVKPGAKVFIEHWGGDHPLVGRVRLVEPSAFTKISALGIEEQRVNILVDFERDQDLGSFGDGYRLEASIVVWEQADVLKVPVGAIFRVASDWAVYVNDLGRASLRLVQLGQQNDQEAEVLDGLKEGTQVVVHPGDRVSEGTPLRQRQL